MPPILKIRYNKKTDYRAKRILSVIGIKKDHPKYDYFVTEVGREFIYDRGRGINFELHTEELDRAKRAWDIIVQQYTEQVMDFKPFGCSLCGTMIREGGKVFPHAEYCPLYEYNLSFVLDIMD